MTSTLVLITTGVAAALASSAVGAQPDSVPLGNKTVRIMRDTGSNPVLRPVPNRSLPTQPGYAWRYFSDPRAVHAVMINSSGEYFLSLGDGPRQITRVAGQETAPAPAQN